MQIEGHTAEPLEPGPSRLEVKIAIRMLIKYKSLGSDDILTELDEAGDEIILSAIYKFINSAWNKGELPTQWKESVIVAQKMVTKLTVIIIVGYHGYLLHTKFYRISFSQD
jgi:hypothetical protein